MHTRRPLSRVRRPLGASWVRNRSTARLLSAKYLAESSVACHPDPLNSEKREATTRTSFSRCPTETSRALWGDFPGYGDDSHIQGTPHAPKHCGWHRAARQRGWFLLEKECSGTNKGGKGRLASPSINGDACMSLRVDLGPALSFRLAEKKMDHPQVSRFSLSACDDSDSVPERDMSHRGAVTCMMFFLSRYRTRHTHKTIKKN